jgi:hypothetical protein
MTQIPAPTSPSSPPDPDSASSPPDSSPEPTASERPASERPASERPRADALRSGFAPARRSSWRRWLLISLIGLVVFVVVIRLLLDPVAAHYTRKALHEAEGIDGDFESVHVTVLPPGYTIRGLRVIESPGGNWQRPLLDAERASVEVEWAKLLHGELSARLRVEEPKIRVIVRKKGAPSVKTSKKPLPTPRDQLAQLVPGRVDRIEIRHGDFVFQDLTAPRQPEIGLHRIEVAAENLASRPGLAHGQPATVSASALLGKSGAVTAFVSADLFAKQLSAAGNAELRNWQVAELYDFEAPATKIQTPKGTLDLFAEFKIKEGAISGGVKPLLKNVEVKPADSGIGPSIKAWLADTALHLFSDRVPGRDAVATVVPIQGRVDDPDVQLWPTVLSILRNAFVEGISSGFSHLPPPVADEKQGPLSQAAETLSKKGRPQAQPESGEK